MCEASMDMKVKIGQSIHNLIFLKLYMIYRIIYLALVVPLVPPTGKTDLVAQVVCVTNYQLQSLNLAPLMPLVPLTGTIFSCKCFPASGKGGTIIFSK